MVYYALGVERVRFFACFQFTSISKLKLFYKQMNLKVVLKEFISSFLPKKSFS